VYTLPAGSLGTPGQTIFASTHNVPIEDIASVLTARYMRDGRAPLLGNIQMNGYRATGAGDAESPQDYVTLAQLQDAIAGITGVPVGVFMPYSVSSTIVPTGYLIANGQSVLRAGYPALWAAVQAGGNLAASEGAKTAGQYGPGDGSTTFTLPNLFADNGYFIRSFSTGRTIGSVQSDAFKAHVHSIDPPSTSTSSSGDHNHAVGVYDGVGGGSRVLRGTGSRTSQQNTDSAGAHTHTIDIPAFDSGSTGDATETRPKNIAFPVLIKAL
jgi:hypothetical protein